MSCHITKHREGFPMGETVITTPQDQELNTGIGLSVLKLEKGEKIETTMTNETAYLLMAGEISAAIDGESFAQKRKSIFDESSSAFHLCKGTQLVLEAVEATEFTIYTVENEASFPPQVYFPQNVPNEPRGKGQVGDTCLRYVRTIFDGSNSHENTQLVLGEVITFPGRWSSYPPHHHNQPEIYHYRFTLPQGFGHGELGIAEGLDPWRRVVPGGGHLRRRSNLAVCLSRPPQRLRNLP